MSPQDRPIHETQIRLMRLEEQGKQFEVALVKLTHTVHGNGEPGLDELVRRMADENERQRREIEAFHAGMRSTATSILRWIIGGMATAIAGTVIWAIRNGALG